MKEIQGKIKFCAIPLNNGMIGYLPLRYEKIGLLSDITEEQAAALVDEMDFIGSFRDYQAEKNEGWSYIITTAKESLISLLKANGFICKSMNIVTPIDVINAHRNGLNITKIPDDLLLIKLK